MRKGFDGRNVNELAIFVFAQFFWCYTGVLFDLLNEMILIGEILFRE